MTTTYYERPEILAHPELGRGHSVIEASAGTGKTYTLEHLVVDLILRSQAKVEEILVVTFTDAATRELRERVRELIRKVCDEGDKKKPAKLDGGHWVVDESARDRLREALFRFDGAAISTIHGFCQRILSEQAFLGGRLFEQEHADGSEMFGLAFREEVRLALVEEGEVGDNLRLWVQDGGTLQGLQELLHACHREGCPDRCPVTPKWDPEGLLKAIDGLPAIEDAKAAGEVLFTNKTAKKSFDCILDALFEIVGRIERGKSNDDAMSAFADWAKKPRSISKVPATQLQHLCMAAEMPGAPDVLQELVNSLQEIEERLAPVAVFFAQDFLPRVQARLEARKRALGLLDYDDMLLGVRGALSGPDAPVLLDALRRRWRYALVDEFQDTDPVQWEIFRRVFVDGTKEHRLFVIGDPKQAIYGFRGADVHTYDLAKRHLIEEHGASHLELPANYRSTKTLIESVNEILTFADGEEETFFTGLNKYENPVECGDLTRAATEKEEPAAPVHLLHLHGGSSTLTAASVGRGVSCFIAEEILRLMHPKTCLVTRGKRRDAAPIKLSDIYVLTRTGRESRRVGEVLRSYGIAHAFYKQDGLFQTEEARDIHSLLCAVDSPSDPAKRMVAWLTPFFGLPLFELASWRGAGESHPLVALLLQWKKRADDHAWSRLFDEIITGSGIVRRLVFLQGERALTNYLHVFEVLLADAHSRPATLAELARALKARIDGRVSPEGREGDVQRLETDRDAVQILTMHKAKGLEAEVVFIGGGFGTPPGGNTRIYHAKNERGFDERRLHIGKPTGLIAELVDDEIRQENERLMYVALTRAKSRLYLPFFGEAPEDAGERIFRYSSLGTFYKVLQERLDAMRAAGLFEDRSCFVLREVSCQLRPPSEEEVMVELQDWPAEGLLEMPATSDSEAARIAPRHRGVLLTSYTRMSRGKSWQAPTADSDDQAARRDEEVGGEVESGEPLLTATTSSEPVGEGDGERLGEAVEIPKGKEAGIFLHALLEDTPPEEIRDRAFEAWSTLEEVQRRAAAAARRHGFTEEHLPAALRMVHVALTTPVDAVCREGKIRPQDACVLDMPAGLSSGARQRAEMAFIYPIPESGHRLLSGGEHSELGDGRPPYEARRGYVQGLVDLVFEHDGKIYLLDWKSDGLPAFDEAALDAHIEANYSLQAKVYSLAILRLLGIESEEAYEARFGGILYAFIRGIWPGEGIWYSRPAWRDVVSWEQELVAREEWGGKAIEPATDGTAPKTTAPPATKRKGARR